MADPKDQKIIAAIVARMQTIQISNGYHTDIGDRVEDSRPNWDEADLPAISVFEGRTESSDESQQNHGRRRTVHEMPVMIKVFLKRGTDASNARIAIADVKKAIRGTGSQSDKYLAERWPSSGVGLAMMTREVGHSIEYAEGTYEITAAQVEIAVQYITEKFNAEQ